MKYTIIILLSCLLTTSLQAQKLNKSEKKALKKELKLMKKDPNRYKVFKEGIEEKESNLRLINTQLADIEESVESNRKVIQEKDEKITDLVRQIADFKKRKSEIEKAVSTQRNIQGLVYKVQVTIDESALYEKVLMEGNEIRKEIKFSGDTDADGTKKYTLGYFRDRAEAEEFRKTLERLKIMGAKVVEYRDNKKVE